MGLIKEVGFSVSSILLETLCYKISSVVDTLKSYKILPLLGSWYTLPDYFINYKIIKEKIKLEYNYQSHRLQKKKIISKIQKLDCFNFDNFYVTLCIFYSTPNLASIHKFKVLWILRHEFFYCNPHILEY